MTERILARQPNTAAAVRLVLVLTPDAVTFLVGAADQAARSGSPAAAEARAALAVAMRRCIFRGRCLEPIHARGLCKDHYSYRLKQVRKNVTTWDDLVKRGDAEAVP